MDRPKETPPSIDSLYNNDEANHHTFPPANVQHTLVAESRPAFSKAREEEEKESAFFVAVNNNLGRNHGAGNAGKQACAALCMP